MHQTIPDQAPWSLPNVNAVSRRRVLFVDAEEGFLSGLRRKLRPLRDAWDMHFYSSPEHALNAAASDDFDFIVSELSLPGIEGPAFLEEVRRRHPDIVRVVLSADERQIGRLRSTGTAHQYVPKASSETIESVVRRSGALRADLNSQAVSSTIANTKSLPTVPSLYQRLVRELRSEDPSLIRIGDIVRQDPAMTAQVLQIINSAYFGLRRRVGDIGHAVTLLGVNTIMALVLSSHLFRQQTLTPEQRTYVEGLWQHSVGTAQLARAIVMIDVSTRALAEEAYLAGILNGCGKLVFVSNWPAEFRQTEAAGGGISTERTVLGADHAFVGGHLMALWGLPDAIVEAVAYHHQPSLCTAGGTPVLAAVHIAQAIEARPDPVTPPQLDLGYLRDAGIGGSLEAWLAAAEDLAYARQSD